MEPITQPPRTRLRRALIGAPVAVAVAVGAWFAIARWRTEPPVTYSTTSVARGEVVQAVTASGTVKPVVQVEVGSQVSGRIAEILVDYNDHVTKGQVLARLDRQLLESTLQQSRARLLQARADLQKAKAVVVNAKAQHARVAGLVESGAIARAEVDTAHAEWRSAEASVHAAAANVTEAEAAVEQARTNLAYTTITSPIDGVVISRSIDVGQTVAASLQAPVLFVLAGDLRDMEVHTSVAESDVGQLAPGMKVEFTVDAFPEKTFTGSVKQVRFEATTNSNVVTYDAVVAVRNDPVLLRPGMTANATFVIAERPDVLTVPVRDPGARGDRPRGPAAAHQRAGAERQRQLADVGHRNLPGAHD